MTIDEEIREDLDKVCQKWIIHKKQLDRELCNAVHALRVDTFNMIPIKATRNPFLDEIPECYVRCYDEEK